MAPGQTLGDPAPGAPGTCAFVGGYVTAGRARSRSAYRRGRGPGLRRAPNREDGMTELMVLTFGDEAGADRVLRALREHEAAGRLRLADTAVVVKDGAEVVRRRGEASSATERAAVVGGATGLAAGAAGAAILVALGVAGGPAGLLLVLLVPLIGLALGAAGGALLGRWLRAGIDGRRVRDVGLDLPVGSSALLLLLRDADPPLLAALRGAAAPAAPAPLPADAAALVEALTS